MDQKSPKKPSCVTKKEYFFFLKVFQIHVGVQALPVKHPGLGMGTVEGLEQQSKGLQLDWTGVWDLGRNRFTYAQHCSVLLKDE